MVHQHFMLVEPFTVLENVVLGAEEGRLLRPSLARARAELKRLEEEYELDVDPDAVVGELSVGLQQRVEILKALYRECDILILDEPTGVLTPAEADHLFRILQHLKAEGKTIVLITHKLREIMAVTDAVSVMRRGEMVRTLRDRRDQPGGARRGDGRAAGAAPGREGAGDAGRGAARGGRSLARRRQGGVAAEVGEPEPAGRRDPRGGREWPGTGSRSCSRCWRGSGRRPRGRVRYKGAALALDSITNADDRRDAGIAHIPEDRHRRGLIMPFARVGELVPRLPARGAVPGAGDDAGPDGDPGSRAGVDREVRRAAAVVRPEDRELLGRQPAEDRDRARDGARSGRAAGRAADPRGRHRGDRVHPPADRGAAGPGQGDPAGLGRARRDPGAHRTGSS